LVQVTIYRMLVDMLMRTMRGAEAAVCLALSVCTLVGAQTPQNSKDGMFLPSTTATQTETDEYTRYELLAPETSSFTIYYEVTATTAGAKVFYNPIRKGSIASDESVYDAMSGEPLHFRGRKRR
jgi:hypothetical protein